MTPDRSARDITKSFLKVVLEEDYLVPKIILADTVALRNIYRKISYEIIYDNVILMKGERERMKKRESSKYVS